MFVEREGEYRRRKRVFIYILHTHTRMRTHVRVYARTTYIGAPAEVFFRRKN